jgi:hypothetical protein
MIFKKVNIELESKNLELVRALLSGGNKNIPYSILESMKLLSQ